MTADRIIFPLDFSNRADAMNHVVLLSGAVGFFKVGLELFTACGPDLVRDIAKPQRAGENVMLDLKLHDIPATMRRAVAVAGDLGAKMVTVHASAGPKAIEACVREAERVGIVIAVVTVLTSLDDGDLAKMGLPQHALDGPGSLCTRTVHRLADMAQRAGANTFVCSPHEINMLRLNIPAVNGVAPALITPGIRGPLDEKADQKRTMSAREAMQEGADYLVIGRPIRDSDDPLNTVGYFAHEIKAGLEARAAR